MLRLVEERLLAAPARRRAAPSRVQGSDCFVAKVDIEVTQASASAIAAVEKNGGRILAGECRRPPVPDPARRHAPRPRRLRRRSLLQRRLPARVAAAAPPAAAAPFPAALPGAGRRLLRVGGEARVPLGGGAAAAAAGAGPPCPSPRPHASPLRTLLRCNWLSCGGGSRRGCRRARQRRSCRSSQVRAEPVVTTGEYA